MKIINNYVPLKYDLMAKKIFGNEKDIKPVKYLIKQILNINAKEIKVLNNEIIDRPYLDKKYAVDLLVETEDKKVIGIEINTDVSNKLVSRNLRYMCRIMSEDLKPNEDYERLKQHIQINFDLEGKHTKPIMRYKLRDEKTSEVLCEDMEIIRINVAYFYKICYNKDASELEKFIGLFNEEDKNRAKILVKGSEDMEDIYEKIIENSEGIIGLYDKESHDREIRKAYMEEKEKEAVERGLEKGIKEGIKEGLEKGRQQGIERGIELGKKENTELIVKKMLKEKIDIELISKVTNLSIDEIYEILNKE